MIILELTIDGAGPFKGTTKTGFNRGLNLITGGNESGKTTIYKCLFSFFDSKYAESQSRFTSGGSGKSTATLIFKTRDGETYKVEQDYLKGKKDVYKFNTSTDGFVLIDNAGDWLVQILNFESGGFAAENLSQVCGLQFNDLQVTFPQPHKSAKITPVVSSEVVIDAGSKEKRLKELHAALKNTDDLSQLEFKLDEVQTKIHDINKRLDELREINASVQANIRKIDSFKNIAGLPENVLDLIALFEKKDKEKCDQIQHIEDELLIKQDEILMIPAEPIYENKIFLAGASIAVISTIVTFSMNLPDIFQHIYLAVLFLGIGAAGYTMFKELQNSTKRSEIEEKIKSMRMELKALSRRHEKDTAPFMELLKLASCKDSSDLRKKCLSYRDLLDNKKVLEGERDNVLKDKDQKALEEEQKSLQSLREELHEKISGYAAMPTNPFEIKAEIERLEGGLVSIPDADALRNIDVIAETDKPLIDFKKIFGKDFSWLSTRFSDQASKNIKKLSIDRYEHLEIDENSNISMRLKESKERITPDMLSSGAMSQMYLSLRFAMFSVLSTKVAFPLLLDDPLLSLDPGRQLLALEILREMSKENQIILLTSNNYHKEPEDNLVHI